MGFGDRWREERRFDEAEARDLARRDLERARDVAAVQNHKRRKVDRKARLELTVFPDPPIGNPYGMATGRTRETEHIGRNSTSEGGS